MLDDKELIPVLRLWAARLVQKGVEFDALISVGYICCKELKSIRLAHMWAKYSMLKFIKEINNSHPELLSDLDADDTQEFDEDNIEEIRRIIDLVNLSDDDRVLLNLRFVKDWKFKQIGDYFGVARPTAHNRYQRVIEKLKRAYTRRDR